MFDFYDTRWEFFWIFYSQNTFNRTQKVTQLGFNTKTFSSLGFKNEI